MIAFGNFLKKDLREIGRCAGYVGMGGGDRLCNAGFLVLVQQAVCGGACIGRDGGYLFLLSNYK